MKGREEVKFSIKKKNLRKIQKNKFQFSVNQRLLKVKIKKNVIKAIKINYKVSKFINLLNQLNI